MLNVRNPYNKQKNCSQHTDWVSMQPENYTSTQYVLFQRRAEKHFVNRNEIMFTSNNFSDLFHENWWKPKFNTYVFDGINS